MVVVVNGGHWDVKMGSAMKRKNTRKPTRGKITVLELEFLIEDLHKSECKAVPISMI